MIRLLWISTWLFLVTAEDCDSEKGFRCGGVNVSSIELDGCRTANKEVGCLHTFDFQMKTGQWNKSVNRSFYEPGQEHCGWMSDSQFSVLCSNDNCDMTANVASRQCFNSTVEITCDGKKFAKKLTNKTNILCVLTLQTSTMPESPLNRTISTGKSDIIIPYSCKFDGKTIDYRCNSDNCDKQFDMSMASSRCTGATHFYCGEKEHLARKNDTTSNPKLKSAHQYCLYFWKRDNGKTYERDSPRLSSADEVNNQKCPVFDYEIVAMACKIDLNNPNKCKNVTLEKHKEYCEDKMESNRKRRLLVNVGFSLFVFLFVLAIFYGSIRSFRKAGKAHSSLLHEYQMEFGSNPMTTSGSKKQKKKKRKEEGGKVKKERGNPPF